MITEMTAPERSAEVLWADVLLQARSSALSHIENSFERNQDILGNLDYHSRLHSIRVARRAVQILETIRSADPTLITDKDLVLTQIASFFHDTVQVWEEKDGRRKRHTGKNEEESADMAAVFMDRINEEFGDIFTFEDREVVREAIHTTVPGFANGTVTQPLLSKDSHIITKAVAMADVDGCLIDGPRLFLGEGDALFREENLDVLRAILGGVENISSDQAEAFRERMLGWLRSQIKFVEGRQALLESDLEGIPEPAFSKVKALFDKGEDSKRELRALIDVREKLPFADLVASFGYGSWLY